MATVVKSIGTDTRDYSTIALWAADHDDDGIYDAGDVAQGECYNDSAFDEYLDIDGGGDIGGTGADLASIVLTVPTAERHDGTAGTGARIEHSGSGQHDMTDGRATILEWLEINGNDVTHGSSTGWIRSQKGSGATNKTWRNLIIHNVRHDSSGSRMLFTQVRGQVDKILNCIIYRLWDNTGSTTVQAISAEVLFGSGAHTVLNNTVHDLEMGGTGNAVGYGIVDDAQTIVKNNIATDCISSEGSSLCFGGEPSSGDTGTNASSDTTAYGAGAVTEITTADQYVSTTRGSEDLHLKSGSDCIDVGEDLGTTEGVNIDIDGRDRDAEGDTWDIGAHEFVSSGVSDSAEPATLSAVATLLSPTVESDENPIVTPDTLSFLATLNAPSLIIDTVVTPSTLSLLASLQVPVIVGGALVEPSTLSAIATLLSPEVETDGNVTVTPSALSILASVLAPDISGTANIAPGTLSIEASLPGSQVGISIAVQPDTLSAVISLLAPSTFEGANVTITASTLSAVATLNAPTLSIDAVLEAQLISGLASLLSPELVIDSIVLVTPLSIEATLQVPNISTETVHIVLSGPSIERYIKSNIGAGTNQKIRISIA